MTDPQRPERPPMPPRNRSGAPFRNALIAMMLVFAGVMAWQWSRTTSEDQPAETSAPAPVVTGEAATTSAATADAAPAPTEAAVPQHPVPTATAADAVPPTPEALSQALDTLVPAPAQRGLLQLEHLAYRIVATVDNLPRAHAPVRMWPVNPAPGRIQLQEGADGVTVLADDNAARYDALVALAEAIDPARAAAVYTRFYPLFQNAYAELGFSGRHFNDRLVEVIDHLLAAPRPAQPLAVRLVEVRSDTPSVRPWVRYEFVDPALEQLSAGQKILLRVGPDNRARLEAVLRAARGAVADGALVRAR